MKDIQLSEHFSLSELIASDTAKANRIDNTPPTEAIINMTILAQRVLEPARQLLGAPSTSPPTTSTNPTARNVSAEHRRINNETH